MSIDAKAMQLIKQTSQLDEQDVKVDTTAEYFDYGKKFDIKAPK